MKILMVCTGNICRSPAAEGVLRSHLAHAGLAGRVTVESAGTHGYHIGDPPDRRMIAAAAARGYDIAGQRARRLVAEDFQAFDLILAMDRGHLAALERQAPAEARAECRLFGSLLPDATAPDVPDPYYEADTAFADVLDLLEAGMPPLVALIRARVEAAA